MFLTWGTGASNISCAKKINGAFWYLLPSTLKKGATVHLLIHNAKEEASVLAHARTVNFRRDKI